MSKRSIDWSEDERAQFADLYACSRAELCRLAFACLHDHSAAEDVVQECWLRLCADPQKLLHVRPYSRTGYLRKTVRNACIDHIRHSKRKPLKMVDGIESIADTVSNSANDSEDDSQSFIRIDLPLLINKLPTRERQVMLSQIKGMSTRDVALSMHLT